VAAGEAPGVVVPAAAAPTPGRDALSVAEGEGEEDAAAGGLGLVPEVEEVGDGGALWLWLGVWLGLRLGV
jgi:hypothetical protein